MKKLIGILILCLLFSSCGYDKGYPIQDTLPDITVAEMMAYDKGYEAGYQSAWDNFNHQCCDVCIFYPTREKVFEFLKEDKTNELKYSREQNCAEFADQLIEHAWLKSIPCYLVEVKCLEWGDESHIIVAFAVCEYDKVELVYIDTQNDSEVKDLEVGKQPIVCNGNLCEFTNVTVTKVRIFK